MTYCCVTGTTNGSVLIYKLNTSCLFKELCIHNHHIHGVEWLSLQALVTLVSRLTCHTHSGHVTYFRKSKMEESPINFIRVSPHKSVTVILINLYIVFILGII